MLSFLQELTISSSLHLYNDLSVHEKGSHSLLVIILLSDLHECKGNILHYPSAFAIMQTLTTLPFASVDHHSIFKILLLFSLSYFQTLLFLISFHQLLLLCYCFQVLRSSIFPRSTFTISQPFGFSENQVCFSLQFRFAFICQIDIPYFTKEKLQDEGKE